MGGIDNRIIPLAIAGLGIGTTEFTIMGLLPDLAKSLAISIPEAGRLISAYAFGVVIGAPILIGYSVKFPPKKVLLALMVLFTFFNGLSALMPYYSSMMVVRFLSTSKGERKPLSLSVIQCLFGGIFNTFNNA